MLFAAALAPRLLVVLAFLRAPIGLDDMFQYDMLARSLAAGTGYRWYGREDVQRMRPYLERYFDIDLPVEQVPPEGFLTTFRAPGYPFFLAPIYALAGLEDRLPAVRLIQALIGASLAPLTALLALRLGLAPRAAPAAGAVIALYPILWMYPIGLASENTFMLLVLLSALALLWADRAQRAPAALAAGLALGAGALTRGAFAAFLPLAALWLWGPWRGAAARRGAVRQALWLTLATSVVLLPWIIRNSRLSGGLAFVENSAGYNLFIGYHPQGTGGFDVRVSVIPLSILDDAERNRWTTEQALSFIRADPLRALSLLPRRLANFWGLEDRELLYFYGNDYFGPIPQPWLLLGYLILVSPLIALGLSAPFGMALAPDSRRRAVPLLMIFAALGAYVPILAEPRFHLPLVPILAAFAAHACFDPSARARIRFGLLHRDAAMWTAAGACVALIALWAWDLAQDWPRLAAVMAPGGHQLGLSY